ncbi:PDZ domain-containing protein [Sphingobacterium sp. WM]|uniref:PDZ domain-containing protein n=1 Tax=Sphingobacterium sp. WM TaxID=3031802 RepID=UPI00240DE8BE|nr:PDZ domain-containing protein [Sphingobacterium sp. WM]WFB62186.1 PDZ domain-containing protein [Sphingobacterium sp. WM]
MHSNLTLRFNKLIILILSLFLFHTISKAQNNKVVFHLSQQGENSNPGTKEKPFKSPEYALDKILEFKKENPDSDVELLVHSGIYHLQKSLELNKDLSSSNGKLIIRALEERKVAFSGAIPLNLKWSKNTNGLWTAKVPSNLNFQSLFTSNVHLIRARYPNYDSKVLPFNGYSEDAIDPERVKKWQNPKGAIVHALHIGRWGGFHYLVTDKKENGELVLEGGLQNNRPSKMHERYRFVENVFEELDSENEWYLDSENSTLYLNFGDKNPNDFEFEAPVLESLISIQGNEDEPIRNVHIEGIKFIHTVPTFMKTTEPLLRSDWTIYRQAAVRIEGAENCSVSNSDFTDLGGNAVFISNYNRNVRIKGNLFERIGAGAINFVGDPDAVRSPSFRYEKFVPENEIDTIPGPKTNNYPADCEASDNLIRNIGLIEKQVAGVQISMASRISVLHNTIYDVPRAGINIGDGTWGGHKISHNDVFRTVLETSDHGAFNSWGRDRFWHPDRKEMDRIVEKHPNWVKLDAIETTVISDNRFSCDHGWDIDLDDGSSNYEIFNNLCLTGGLKLREGFYRTVYNNIMINNGFHPHVWFKDGHDIFRNNIVMHNHQDIQVKYWGDKVDRNYYTREKDLLVDQAKGVDQHSTPVKLEFTDISTGKFKLKSGSLDGFKEINLQDVGVMSSRLKDGSDSPFIPEIEVEGTIKEGEIFEWKGAKLKSIETLGEQSAAGLPTMEGVLVLGLSENSPLLKAGIQNADVIVSCQGESVKDLGELQKVFKRDQYMNKFNFEIFRNQEKKKIEVSL